MKSIKLSALGLLLALITACVTINIYFPAAAADMAAERIIDDILGKPAPPPPPADDNKGASLLQDSHQQRSFNPLEWLIPSAQAADSDFTADSPQIRQLQAKMKQRHERLAPYYTSGAVGYTSDGMVAMRDTQAVALKERALLSQLLSEENRDRDALYQAIAAANGHPEWEPQVRSVFAGKWIDRATTGWWFQTADGQWRQK